MSASEFRRKLETLINVENREGGSNTPDFILADYLVTCLEAFDKAAMRRDDWYGVELRPGMRSAVGGATAGEAKPAPDLSGIATCRDCTAERTCDRCAAWLAGRP